MTFDHQAIDCLADGQLIGDDDPVVLLTAFHPLQMKSQVVRRVVCKDGAAVTCGVDQLVFVARAPSVKVVSADHVEAPQAKGGCDSLVDVFVEVEADEQR